MQPEPAWDSLGLVASKWKRIQALRRVGKKPRKRRNKRRHVLEMERKAQEAENAVCS